MNSQKALHLSRLQERLQEIDGFLRNNVNARAPEFRDWKARTQHSLSELFGESHNYSRRFLSLRFWNERLKISHYKDSRPSWSEEDQTIFVRDLKTARGILTDALEELPVLPARSEPTTASEPSKETKIVVNVHNVLAQSTHIELSQVMSNLDALDLLPDKLSEAKGYARELEKEVRGEQRWPVLAKPLEALRLMSKSVYENVALPLILEMLKRQTGLSG